MRGMGSSSPSSTTASTSATSGLPPGCLPHRWRRWWNDRRRLLRRRGLSTVGRRAWSDLLSKKRMTASPRFAGSEEMMIRPAR